VLDRSPYGSRAIAILEQEKDGAYRCALDIYSKQGPFIASAVGRTPLESVRAIEAKIGRQLELWRKNRGMGGTPPLDGARPVRVGT
jgi:hypothetical protein